MTKILVTGARGFIGQNCIELLKNTAFEVHAVSSSKVFQEKNTNVTWHQANLLDSNDISTLLKDIKPTHILHLAWITTPRIYWNSLENYKWIKSSLNLIETFNSLKGERIVISGTCAEYDLNYGYLSEKLTPLNPDSIYGSSKYALYILLNSLAKRNKDFSWAWGRIFYPYGKYENQQRLVPSVICSLLNDKPAFCSHGEQIRDFIYAGDVADIFIELLENDIGGAINIGSGIPIRLKDIVNKVGEKLNKKDLIKLGVIESPTNEQPLTLADISRLKNEMKWKPKYDLDEGIKKTIDWWKNNIEDTNENQ